MRLPTNRLEPGDVTTYKGLPVTTAPLTIAHVSTAGLADEFIIQAVQEAIQRGMVTKKQVRELTQQQGGRTQHPIQHALDYDHHANHHPGGLRISPLASRNTGGN